MVAGLVAINVAAIIFGTAALYGKLDISPFWIVAMRAFFATWTLLAFGLIRGRLEIWNLNSQGRKLILTGVVLALHWLTFFASVQLAGVAVATLTFATFPLFTNLLVACLSRRLPTLIEIGSGFIIVAAVALLVDFNGTGPRALGAVAGLASAILFAFFGIAAKGLTSTLTPLTVSIVQNLVVAVCLAPLLPFASPPPISFNDWFWLLMLGVVTTAFMHQLYLYALTKLSAGTCSSFIALEPVYAVAFASLLFNEPLDMWIFVSGGLIIGASALLLRSELVFDASLAAKSSD